MACRLLGGELYVEETDEIGDEQSSEDERLRFSDMVVNVVLSVARMGESNTRGGGDEIRGSICSFPEDVSVDIDEFQFVSRALNV